MKVSKFAKTVVAGVFAAASIATVALGDDVLSTTEMVNMALAVLGAFGVYVVPNASADDKV